MAEISYLNRSWAALAFLLRSLFLDVGRGAASWSGGMAGSFLRIRKDFWESVSLRVSEESPPVSLGPRGVPTGVLCGVTIDVPETSLLSLNI